LGLRSRFGDGLRAVTLYGSPLVARRRIGFAAVDPQISHELFMRHALVDRDWRSSHRF
jgi:ATP-dependent helicase HrpA